ncbi:hypothetical protein BT96DRAFT_981268 [Gymnopus androsaceus JB14]|uniref:DUF125-domain-containing protein n=1 Tax=Gymnopus androsaceus JB14 TaxID=1447944 RepID=A0A6A4GRN3_9AGAR|nr:hypothetical protein BT96DRAFT_981268 [Gymnopus androsaceus JB14]
MLALPLAERLVIAEQRLADKRPRDHENFHLHPFSIFLADAQCQKALYLTSVALPRRTDDGTKTTKPPVWSITSSVTNDLPLSSECDRTSRADGVCCKELRQEERTLIDPDIVRDVIIGLSDGLTVPFALTAGLSSLGTSRLVVLGGVAELIAGAISMGIGGFLASQAERDHFRFLKKQTAARVSVSCAGEMEREVEEILGPLGVDEKACRVVAESLRKAGRETVPEANAAETLKLRWSNDIGLTAFLLKFGEGMEEVPTKRLYISAFTIGMGYLIGGLIPLFPVLFHWPCTHCALVLVHPNGRGAAHLWCYKSTSDWCEWRCGWHYMGCGHYSPCRRCCCRCCICYRSSFGKWRRRLDNFVPLTYHRQVFRRT